MPPYDFVCEDCGRPVDGNIDGRCAACREEGEFTTFPGPTGLYDALLVWSRINSVPVSELMPDL